MTKAPLGGEKNRTKPNRSRESFRQPPSGFLALTLGLLSLLVMILFGLYRRHMHTIRHLGTMDRLFGVPSPPATGTHHDRGEGAGKPTPLEQRTG
jgi:hypothetical protein